MTLKALYKKKAEEHYEAIAGFVKSRLESVGRAADSISDEIVDRFVRNCRALKVVRMRSVAEEKSSPDMEHLEECYFDMSAWEEDADGDEKEGLYCTLCVWLFCLFSEFSGIFLFDCMFVQMHRQSHLYPRW